MYLNDSIKGPPMNQPNFLIKGITISLFIGLMLGFVLFRAGWLELGMGKNASPSNSSLAINTVSESYHIDSPPVNSNVDLTDIDSVPTFLPSSKLAPILNPHELEKQPPQDSVMYKGKKMSQKDAHFLMSSSKSAAIATYQDFSKTNLIDSLNQIDTNYYQKKLTPPTTRFPTSDFISSSKSFIVLDPEDFLPYSFKKFGLQKPNDNHQYFMIDSIKLKWQNP